MKKKHWIWLIVIVLASAVLVYLTTRQCYAHSEVEDVDDSCDDNCEYDYWESGTELFESRGQEL